MTGKEALEYIANLLFMFTSAGRKSGKDYVLKALCKIEDELDELAKYKKAFEILKSKEIFEFKDYTNMIFLKPEDYIWNGDIIEEMFINVNEEEYELLEELMKDER